MKEIFAKKNKIMHYKEWWVWSCVW